MKLKATLVFKDNKELRSFIGKWNRLPNSLAKKQASELKLVESYIKQTLDQDERPTKNKIPWQGHNYTGSLSDSVFSSTEANEKGVSSKIGYGAKHGIYLEPGTSLKNNVFVPYGWSSDAKATLDGRGNASQGIPNRPESFSDLQSWAYDIVTNRTTGEKVSGAVADRRANRWAARLQYVIENMGQIGYPIIIPHLELMFGTPGSESDYLARISKFIQDKMGLESNQDEVPF